MKTKSFNKYFQAVSIVLVLAICTLFIEPPANVFLSEVKALQVSGQKTYGLNTKWAFLVGIDKYPYMPAKNQLTGCVNDVNDVEYTLVSLYDFLPKNVKKLINRDATRNNILNYLEQMAKTVKRGDIFTFYFSGHGTFFPDRDSLEQDEKNIITPACNEPPCPPPDTYDSALCPTDVCIKGKCFSSNQNGWGNKILDDELFEIFSRFTSKGCMVVFITDSCHSGTVGRGTRSNNKEGFDGFGEGVKYLPPNILLEKSFLESPTSGISKAPTRVIDRDMKGLYLVISSSQDYQFSYETEENGLQRGLFTSILTRTMKTMGGEVSYRRLFGEVEHQVALDRQTKPDRPQKPSLTSRYVKEELLNMPLFSFPNDKELGVAVKVVDKIDNPLANSYFVILKAGIKPESKSKITKQDTIIIAKTDERGLFKSEQKVLSPGKYWVKVVRKGFQTYIRELDVKAGASEDMAVFKFEMASDINGNKPRSNDYEKEDFNDEEFFELQLDEQTDDE